MVGFAFLLFSPRAQEGWPGPGEHPAGGQKRNPQGTPVQTVVEHLPDIAGQVFMTEFDFFFAFFSKGPARRVSQ